MAERAHVIGCSQEPILGRLGIGDGLLGCEGLGSSEKRGLATMRVCVCACMIVCARVCAWTHLGGDDEECGLCVKLSQSLGHVSAVDVGDEPDIWTTFRVRLQRLCHHQGSLKATK